MGTVAEKHEAVLNLINQHLSNIYAQHTLTPENGQYKIAPFFFWNNFGNYFFLSKSSKRKLFIFHFVNIQGKAELRSEVLFVQHWLLIFSFPDASFSQMAKPATFLAICIVEVHWYTFNVLRYFNEILLLQKIVNMCIPKDLVVAWLNSRHSCWSKKAT